MAVKKRSTAPNVKVSGMYRSMRAEMLKELEAEDKDFSYCYMPADVNARALERGGLELVKDDDGKPLRWREDLIAKQPKENVERKRELQTEASASVVESLYCTKPEDLGDASRDEYWKKNSAGRRVAKPKDPSEVDNYGGM